MSGVRITMRGDAQLTANFRNAPAKLTGNLQTMAVELALDAREKAATLAGARSGRLRGSIKGEVITTDQKVAIRLGSSGVPYARIQERGGTTPPHVIMPHGTALAFFWATFSDLKQGDAALFSKVQHPGGVIPGKHYIREGMNSIREQFRTECRRAMADAMAGRSL